MKKEDENQHQNGILKNSNLVQNIMKKENYWRINSKIKQKKLNHGNLNLKEKHNNEFNIFNLISYFLIFLQFV